MRATARRPAIGAKVLPGWLRPIASRHTISKEDARAMANIDERVPVLIELSEQDDDELRAKRDEDGNPCLGMAPLALLHIYKVLGDAGDGTDAPIIKALDHIAETKAAAGGPVIHGVNLSFGGDFDFESCAGTATTRAPAFPTWSTC